MKEKQLQLVSYSQAQRLKAAGFDWYCEWYYRDNLPDTNTLLQCVNNMSQDFNACIHKFSAPTVVLALKWFRDEKRIKSAVNLYGQGIFCGYAGRLCKRNIFDKMTGVFDTYEAAESTLLDELLTLIEKEK